MTPPADGDRRDSPGEGLGPDEGRKRPAGEVDLAVERLRRLLDDDEVIDLVFDVLQQVAGMAHGGIEGHPAGEKGDAFGSEASKSVPAAADRAGGEHWIGPYRILRRIGSGGMAIVYEAEQPGLGRRVALKVLPRAGELDAEMLQRFRLEAQAAARLHHPHIVPIHEVGESGGVHYYAMQFIEGESLDLLLGALRRLHPGRERSGDRPSTGKEAPVRESAAPRCGFPEEREELLRMARALLDGDGAGSPAAPSVSPEPGPRAAGDPSGAGYFRRIATIGLEVAAGLAHAHERGVLHRDIKPSNILLDRNGNAWIADFGLAKSTGGDDLTQSGEVVGSLRYMGPERFQGWSDPRSDVYSLGITLYELSTLVPAFGATERASLLHQILHSEPIPPRMIDPRIPRHLETIILKAIEKEPGRRYPSASALEEDLRRFIEGRPIAARRASIPERTLLWCRRNPLAAVMAFIAAGIFLLAMVASIVAAVLFYEMANDLRVERDASQMQLWISCLAEASSARNLRQGQRGESQAAIEQAAAISKELQLRDEAILTLCLADLRPARNLSVKIPLPSGFAFDPSLRRWAHVDPAGILRIRDAERGVEVASLPGFNSKVQTLCFDSEGRCIAVRYDEKLRLLDLEIPDRSLEFSLTFLLPVSMSFSSDGSRFAVLETSPEGDAAGSDIAIVDLERFRVERRIPVGSHRVRCMAFRPDGEVLAVGTERGVGRLLRGGDSVEAWIPLESQPVDLAWDHRGDLLAVALENRKIHLWDARAKTPRDVLDGQQGTIRRAIFDPTGSLLVTTSTAGACLWDVPSRRLLLRFDADFAIFDGGGRLGRRLGEDAEILDVIAGREYRCINEPGWKGALTSVDIGLEGRLLAASGIDAVHLWDLAELRELGSIPTAAEEVRFDGAGGLRTRGSALGSSRLWPIRRTRERDEEIVHIGLPEPSSESDAATSDARQASTSSLTVLSLDGRWRITGSRREYRFWRAGGPEPLQRFDRIDNASPPVAVFSRDSTLAAVSLSGTRILLVAVQEARAVAHLEAPEIAQQAPTTWLSLGEDGAWLAAATAKPSIHLWNLGRIRRGLEALGLAGEMDDCAAFHAAGRENPASVLPMRVVLESREDQDPLRSEEASNEK